MHARVERTLIPPKGLYQPVKKRVLRLSARSKGCQQAQTCNHCMTMFWESIRAPSYEIWARSAGLAQFPRSRLATLSFVKFRCSYEKPGCRDWDIGFCYRVLENRANFFFFLFIYWYKPSSPFDREETFFDTESCVAFSTEGLDGGASKTLNTKIFPSITSNS